MHASVIDILYRPKLKAPILITGFRGWSDALGIATGLVGYLILKLRGKQFAQISPGRFFHYDQDRPTVEIVNGTITSYKSPGGSFYAVKSPDMQRDLIIFRGDEPTLAWDLFSDTILDLCDKLGVDTIISVGGLFDQILHTNRMISALVSTPALQQPLKRFGVVPTNYTGPAAIHTVIHAAGTSRKLDCYSLWCHCPIYIQNAIHYGYISDLGSLLSHLGNFSLDVGELELNWQKILEKIDQMVANNSELQEIVNKIQFSASAVPPGSITPPHPKSGKVIDLKDFLPPRAPEQI